jgi:amino acid transporter
MCGEKCTKFSFVILVMFNVLLILLSLVSIITIGVSMSDGAKEKIGNSVDVDLSEVYKLVPAEFKTAAMAFGVMVMLLACCGCCGALTMKRAADAAENEDEYDYADEFGKDQKKSTALLVYIILLFIFMIVQVVFAAGLLALSGKLGEEAEKKANSAEESSSKVVQKIKDTLVKASNGSKLQKAWIKMQNGMKCCGMNARCTATEDTTCPNIWMVADNETQYCTSDYNGADGTAEGAPCAPKIFKHLVENIKPAGMVALAVFFIEALCFGSAIHLKCCAVKKKD